MVPCLAYPAVIWLTWPLPDGRALHFTWTYLALPLQVLSVLCAPLPAMTTPLFVSFSLSHSLTHSLSLALNPPLYLPLATFANLRVSRRSLIGTRDVSSRCFPPPTICKPLPPHLPASRPRYFSHSLQPLDLIDRCQPPALCATDCSIVSYNRPRFVERVPAISQYPHI